MEQLDLGVVQAGESKTYEFYVSNDSKAYLRNLRFGANHPEVNVLKYPESLDPEEIGLLIVEWKPSVTLKEGLRTTLQIEGKEIWK